MTWWAAADWPDIINGSLEGMGGLFILLSILRLYKDKVVRGVSWVHVAFFAAWGFWNLFYYPHLGQWWSFAGGVGIVTTNTFWLLQMAWYLYVGRRHDRWVAERSGNRWPVYEDTH